MSKYLDNDGLTYALSKMKSVINDTIDSKNTVVAYENFYIPETTTIPHEYTVDNVYCKYNALIPLGIVEISSDNVISNVDLQLHVSFKYGYPLINSNIGNNNCEGGLRINYVKRNKYKSISLKSGNAAFTTNANCDGGVTGTIYVKVIDSNKYAVYAQIELGGDEYYPKYGDVKGALNGSVYVYWYLKKVNSELDTVDVKISKPTDNIVERKAYSTSDPYESAVSALKSSSGVVMRNAIVSTT